jgi:tetratricopeptide (TPR) repeat protein
VLFLPTDVATSLSNLAALYVDQGRYAEAEPLNKRSMMIREKVFGPDHPDVATSLNNLAYSYESQGRYAEAEPLYKRSLAINEKAFGFNHANVANYPRRKVFFASIKASPPEIKSSILFAFMVLARRISFAFSAPCRQASPRQVARDSFVRQSTGLGAGSSLMRRVGSTTVSCPTPHFLVSGRDAKPEIRLNRDY